MVRKTNLNIFASKPLFVFKYILVNVDARKVCTRYERENLSYLVLKLPWPCKKLIAYLEPNGPEIVYGKSLKVVVHWRFKC